MLLLLGLGRLFGDGRAVDVLRGEQLAAERAVAHANGGLGEAQLREPLLRHVLGEALVVPLVSHAAGLDPDDGVYDTAGRLALLSFYAGSGPEERERTLLAESINVLEQPHGYALEILELGLGEGSRVPDLGQAELQRRGRGRGGRPGEGQTPEAVGTRRERPAESRCGHLCWVCVCMCVYLAEAETGAAIGGQMGWLLAGRGCSQKKLPRYFSWGRPNAGAWEKRVGRLLGTLGDLGCCLAVQDIDDSANHSCV